ncbi:MAG: nucleotidyltransferase family protein [Clostridia bacterium]|nr:nucleotidyltransferase family protein [Clostridia bacterium]
MQPSFLPFIRCALWGGEAPVIDDWGALFADLRKHCLTSLGYKNADISNMPEALRQAWDKERAYLLIEYLRILAAQNEITDLLGGQNIPHVIVKGLAAGRYYPDPAKRTYGDIDILIPTEADFDKAEKLLLENKYIYIPKSNVSDDDRPDERHHAYEKKRVNFEIHRYFSMGKDETDKELDKTLSAVEPVLIQMEDHRFYAFPEPYNGITILEHIRHHLITGIGFRQIIDWCCYVDKVLTDECWKSDFEPLADRLSLRAMAIHLTRLCEIYFGLSHRAFAEEADDAVCTALFEEIDTAGNFGMTLDYGDFEVRSAIVNGNILKHLQKNGLNQWPAVKKHKWLRPFAWLWQGWRIFINLLSKKQLLHTLGGLFRHKAKEKSAGPDMWEVLGIGKYRKG